MRDKKKLATEKTDMEVLQEMMAQPIRTELTRRDHFALAALAALLQPTRVCDPAVADWYAMTAYTLADAMEKARGTPAQSKT